VPFNLNIQTKVFNVNYGIYKICNLRRFMDQSIGPFILRNLGHLANFGATAARARVPAASASATEEQSAGVIDGRACLVLAGV